MSRVDLNFDAREVYVVSRNLYDIDVKAEGAILEEVIASIGESVILDEIGIDKLIEYLENHGYTVEENNE
tara:strand:- start:680 stop:889 length:210 start_codon:yes stop_codon:yes gene_type:complete